MFRLRDVPVVAMAAAALLLTGCAGAGTVPSTATSSGGSANGGPAAVSVAISPQSLVSKHGDRWNFVAAVTNSFDPRVSWSIQEGSTGGVISDFGAYTAPAANGIYHVIATSKADTTKSATTTVNVGNTGFTLTDGLTNVRFDHTATLLPNGQVFIAGGCSTNDWDFSLVDQTELFNPATGTFQSGVESARCGHTATLLPNGDVLLAGGIVNTQDLLTDTAELLKAGTGLLQPTGGMRVGRYSHAATVLQDGRVLISGGYVGSAPNIRSTQTAELYDPSSGTFTPVGDMRTARAGHSATLLSNGKVLIVGGGVADAEIFDPTTNTFMAAGSTSSKSVSTATLLTGGRVLVTGEVTADGSAAAPAELYDTATGTFTPTGTMVTPTRFGYTATLLPDGTVLVAGGIMFVASSTPGSVTSVPVLASEIYNPATGSFSPGPTMHQGRYAHTATLLPDGSVFFVGTSARAEIYQ